MGGARLWVGGTHAPHAATGLGFCGKLGGLMDWHTHTGLRAQVVADDYALAQGAWLHPAGVRVAAGFAGSLGVCYARSSRTAFGRDAIRLYEYVVCGV